MTDTLNPLGLLNHGIPQTPIRPVAPAATAAAVLPVFHTVEQVAVVLDVSTKTIRRRIREGVIRKVPMGGRLVRISSAELCRLAADAPPRPSVSNDEVSMS